METITLDKKEYSDLLEMERKLKKILAMKVLKETGTGGKDAFLKAFGILKENLLHDILCAKRQNKKSAGGKGYRREGESLPYLSGISGVYCFSYVERGKWSSIGR